MGLELARPPGFEGGGRIGHQLQPHVAVLQAAVLGALAEVAARPVRLDPGDVGLARDGVGLAGERGDPEGMDDIVGPQPDLHRHAHRHVQLVGGGEDAGGLGAEIADVPPPLLARDLDGEGRGVGGLVDLGQDRDRPDQGGDEGHRRDGEADGDPPEAIAAMFNRLGAEAAESAARATGEHAPDQQDGDDHHHNDGDHQKAPGQVSDRIGLGAVAGEVRHRRRRGGEGRQPERRSGGPGREPPARRGHRATAPSLRDAGAGSEIRAQSSAMAAARNARQPGIHMIAPPSC